METGLLAVALPREEQVVQLLHPLPVVVGDYLLLGNAGEERARVTAVDPSGLLVTVERAAPQPHPLLSYVFVNEES